MGWQDAPVEETSSWQNAPEEMEQPRAEQQPDKSFVDSLTEAKTWFGEGPPPSMPLFQRGRRVGEAAGIGALIGGGVGALGAGVGAAPGALIGGTAGALGEIGEQVASGLGIGRGGQVLTGAVAGSPVGLADLLYSGGKAIGPVIKSAASVIPGTKGFALRRLLNEAAAKEGLAPDVMAAVQAARSRLAEGGEQATREFGEATRQAVGEEKAGFENAAQLARERAEQYAAKFNTAANEREALYYQQAEQANKQLADTLDQGIGKGSSSFDLGNKIRTKIVSIFNPEAAARAEAYNTARTAAMESAAQREAQGEFWAGSPEAQQIRDKWLKIAEGSEEGVKKDILRVINQIWKQKQKTTQVQEPVSGFGGTYTKSKEVTESVPEYAPATKMDEIIRMLGQVYEKEAPEGFKAIGAANARELRKDLSLGINKEGGFYDWSGLGEAKAGYKQASDALSRFESRRADQLLSKQFGVDVYKTDAESLSKSMLGSQSGVNELLKITRDPKVVSEYLDEYVRGQLRGKNPQQVQKWLDDPNNSYVEKYLPNIRQEITDYVGKAGILERQAGKFTEAAKTTTQQKVNPFVQRSAQEYVDKLGIYGAEGKMMDANKILDNILSSNFSNAKMQEVGRLIGDQPGMKNNMFDAVALRLSNVSPNRIMAEFDKLEPALRGFQGVTDADIAAMKNRLQQVVLAAQKNPEVSATGNIKKALFGFGTRTVGRSILRPAITGRMDTEKDQEQ